MRRTARNVVVGLAPADIADQFSVCTLGLAASGCGGVPVSGVLAMQDACAGRLGGEPGWLRTGSGGAAALALSGRHQWLCWRLGDLAEQRGRPAWRRRRLSEPEHRAAGGRCDDVRGAHHQVRYLMRQIRAAGRRRRTMPARGGAGCAWRAAEMTNEVFGTPYGEMPVNVAVPRSRALAGVVVIHDFGGMSQDCGTRPTGWPAKDTWPRRRPVLLGQPAPLPVDHHARDRGEAGRTFDDIDSVRAWQSRPRSSAPARSA